MTLARAYMHESDTHQICIKQSDSTVTMVTRRASCSLHVPLSSRVTSVTLKSFNCAAEALAFPFFLIYTYNCKYTICRMAKKPSPLYVEKQRASFNAIVLPLCVYIRIDFDGIDYCKLELNGSRRPLNSAT